MIQEFSVENCLSFRDKETISFVATTDKKAIDELTWETKPGGGKVTAALPDLRCQRIGKKQPVIRYAGCMVYVVFFKLPGRQ
ncbi:MAG: hypothetical protein LUE93_02785 [Bacteroides sp.]|nr:hypothetical protein [Bacteroides sp.]